MRCFVVKPWRLIMRRILCFFAIRQAVEERRLQKQRARAIDRLLKLRSQRKPITMEEFNEARRAGRP